ncbi:hypothetical protein HOY81_24645, partial [Streptomyces sp. JJ36]|nr:hypothetical protein [Streptomyces sp. JJ36]
MTAQNGRGQGDGPYEGVVLPANGEPWTPEQQRQAAAQQPQPAPGQPWDQHWGPEGAPPAAQAPSGGPAWDGRPEAPSGWTGSSAISRR